MCSIELEPCEVWQERKVTARKDHRCSCCGGRIRAGEVYVRHFSVFEGDVSAEKSCAACEEMRRDFREEHHGTCGTPGYMQTLLEECIDYEDEGTGAKWRAAIDAMRARRAAAEAAA